MCAFMVHRLVLILHWLSGNSLSIFREGRCRHYQGPALLYPVLGSNLQTYKTLFSHWRTCDFSFLCTSGGWEMFLPVGVFILQTFLRPAECWTVFCVHRSPRCLSLACFCRAEFLDNAMSEGCVSLSLTSPQQGAYTAEMMAFPAFLSGFWIPLLLLCDYTLFRGSLRLAVAHC